MPAKSTELWSESTSSKGAAGWTARRGWVVTGATSDEEARNAAPLDGRPIPAIDASHPENAALRVSALPVSPGKGPSVRIVHAEYEIPSSGTVGGDPNADPLNAPPQYFLEHVASNEPIYREPGIAGDLIVNAAGDPFDPPLTRDVFDLQITITRNEPFFPLAKSMTYRNVVNSQPYTIPAVGQADKGQLLCLPMKMVSPITAQSTYVPVIYTLLAREDGWKFHILNAGFNGWYNAGGTYKKGRFKDEFGVLSAPILLGPDGKPLLSGYTIATPSGDGATPLANPNPISNAHLGQIKNEWYLNYSRFEELDFANLL
jgi:hypothetical protein